MNEVRNMREAGFSKNRWGMLDMKMGEEGDWVDLRYLVGINGEERQT